MPVGERRKPLLTVEKLRMHIPTRRGVICAVDGVSFTLAKGKTLAVVGESGCGKSMLCKTIMGLSPRGAWLSPDSMVMFEGVDLLKQPEAALNRLRGSRLAMVFQDPFSSLHPTMKVGRQIAEPLLHHRKKTSAQVREKVQALISAVGLSSPGDCAGMYPHQLSGGMRQRIAIAISLACDPNLLIADEPTTGLDATIQAGILDLLKRQQSMRNMALLLVTHDLGAAYQMADHVAVMYAGRLVEIGPVDEIFSRPRHHYTRMLITSIPWLHDLVEPDCFSSGRRSGESQPAATGCSFRHRCAHWSDRCGRESPDLLQGDVAEHYYACWQPLSGDA